MTAALINSAAAGSSAGSATTSAVNMTGATLLIAVVSSSGGDAAISDSSSNTWTTGWAQSGVGGLGWYYCSNPTVSASQTFTANAGFVGLVVLGFSGTVASTTPDLNVHSTTGDPTGGSGATPAHDNEVILTACAAAASMTAPSGSWTSDIEQFVGGTNYGVGVAWLFQTAAASVDPVWSSATIHGSALFSFQSTVVPKNPGILAVM